MIILISQIYYFCCHCILNNYQKLQENHFYIKIKKRKREKVWTGKLILLVWIDFKCVLEKFKMSNILVFKSKKNATLLLEIEWRRCIIGLNISILIFNSIFQQQAIVFGNFSIWCNSRGLSWIVRVIFLLWLDVSQAVESRKYYK